MNHRRIEIEVTPNSLKFNPINKKKKKKKNITQCHDDDEIDLLIVPPTLFFFKQDKQDLFLLIMEMMMLMMVGNSSSSSRLKQFGFYLVASIHEKHKLASASSDSAHHKLILLTYALLPILAFLNAAGSSKLFRSITPHDYFVQPPPHKSPNTITITSSSSSALISTHTTSISPPIIDDWFVFEILTRLPVKSLVRFKTVSKRWGSLIEKDQNFIASHLLNRSKTSLRRLFIINPVPLPPPNITRPPKVNQNEYVDGSNEMFCWDKGHDNESYITADLILFQQHNNNSKNVVVVDTVGEVDSNSYDFVSNPLNGLICLIESNYKYAVRIWNISTRELSPWFQSSLLSEEIGDNGIPRCWMKNYTNATPNYQFGFDPSSNEQKLVCLWNVFSKEFERKYLICEVLTVRPQGINGNNRWRRIEEVPDDLPYRPTNGSVHVNGVIYWSSFRFHYGVWDSKHRPICILAFDVRMEKFRIITVPDFILDQPRDDIKRDFNPLYSDSYSTKNGELVNLLEVGGRLAMLVRMTNCMFKMHIYEDDDCKLEEEINITPTVSGWSLSSNNNGRWSEAGSMTLPFSLGEKCGVRFCKFVGSDDEIILTSSEGRNCDKDVGRKECVSFYSYNWKKGSWREFEVSGIPSSVPHLCTGSYVTTFSESLLPVNNDKTLF